MKKAKLWAYLMSGLLTFSTLASDYQIAYAEEAVEADAGEASESEAEPVFHQSTKQNNQLL